MKIKNFINGQFEETSSTLPNENPATGEVYSQIPDGHAEDVERAVQAAKNALPLWSGLSKKERSSYLKKIGALLEERREEFAQAESLDTGKPISLARAVDIPRAIKNFEFFSEQIFFTHDKAFPSDEPKSLNYTQRSPLGVVGAISPWNLPLYLLTWKLAPALACGNTVVAKPSEVTPMTAYLLSQILAEVGLPKGVVNIVHGTGPKVGAPLCQHKDVNAISFTGSTQTGKAIGEMAAATYKKVSLELGGKNPNIIFEDADLKSAVKNSLHASFANNGQVCLCGSRLFIQKSIYDEFKQSFVKKTQELVVGNPLDEKTHQGSMVSKAHYEKVLSYLTLAQEEGGRFLTGGKPLPGPGYFIPPTIIEGLPSDCRINQEEIFGPVVSLIPFESEEEVLEQANSVSYGLSASVWTQDINRAHRVAEKLEAGTVWVNCWMVRDLQVPFGGVKNSGLGREGGEYALNFYTETKNICLRLK